MTGASGAPYAVRLLQVLSQLGRTIHLTLSPSAVQVLREEMDLDVALDSFDPTIFGGLGAGPARLSSLPGFHRGDRQRLVPDRRHGHHPVQHEYAGGDRRRDHHQSDHTRSRRASQGTAQADPGSSRDATEPHSPGKHADGHAGRGSRAAGHAGLVSPPSPPRRLINFVVARICDQLGIDNSLIARWGQATGHDTREESHWDQSLERRRVTSRTDRGSVSMMPSDGGAPGSRPGPVVLLTGASAGIGAALARELARREEGGGTRADGPPRRSTGPARRRVEDASAGPRGPHDRGRPRRPGDARAPGRRDRLSIRRARRA